MLSNRRWPMGIGSAASFAPLGDGSMRQPPVRVADGLDDLARFRRSAWVSVQQTGDRRLVEEVVDAPGHFLPPMVSGAWIRVAAGGSPNEAAPLTHGLERGDDAGEGDAVRRAGEAESTFGPTLGAEDAGPREEVERLGEVVARATDDARDLVDADRTVVCATGDAENSL